MKKLAVIASIFLTVATFTLSIYAMGDGMGGGIPGSMGGSGMTSNFGTNLLDWLQKWRNGSEYATPSRRESEPIEELEKQHHEDSVYLKYQIQMREKELDALLNMKDLDIDKVRATHRDIQELRSLADQEQHSYELEAGKMNTGYRSDSSDGRAHGRSGKGDMDYGGSMMGYAQGQ